MRRLIVNSVAVIIIFAGSFFALSDVSYAKQPGSTCTSGDGDMCFCGGSCWANSTSCGCN